MVFIQEITEPCSYLGNRDIRPALPLVGGVGNRLSPAIVDLPHIPPAIPANGCGRIPVVDLANTIDGTSPGGGCIMGPKAVTSIEVHGIRAIPVAGVVRVQQDRFIFRIDENGILTLCGSAAGSNGNIR